jgi:hypothetical protein
MMNWNESERKRSWPNFKVLSRHSSGESEENHGNFSQDSRYTRRDLNPGPPEYEAGVLSTCPRRLA